MSGNVGVGVVEYVNLGGVGKDGVVLFAIPVPLVVALVVATAMAAMTWNTVSTGVLTDGSTGTAT